jgi:transposase-like protein
MTISEFAARFGVHPTMVTGWKRALQEGAAEIFEKGHNARQDLEAQKDELYCQIGRLQVKRDFLARKLSL